MMGINDIGWPDSPLVPAGEPAPSADDIIAGYKQLIARAHMHGLKIIGATLTPFENTFAGGPLAAYYNADKEKKRVAVNEFIRNGGEFDGVIDFDAVVRIPDDPKKIKAEFDSGRPPPSQRRGLRCDGECGRPVAPRDRQVARSRPVRRR